jgi:trehalose 6-phosphate phosphatase
MDLKPNHTSPVLTDPAPMNKSILGVHSSLLPYPSPRAAFPPSLFLTIPRKKTGILGDVRSSSWLDAMKSSSPPPRKITKGAGNEYASSDSDADVAYNAWMVFLLPVVFYFLFFYFGSFLSRIYG